MARDSWGWEGYYTPPPPPSSPGVRTLSGKTAPGGEAQGRTSHERRFFRYIAHTDSPRALMGFPTPHPHCAAQKRDREQG